MLRSQINIFRVASLAATCLAINVGLGKIANILLLPFAFDTAGTMLAAVLLPWPYCLAVAAASSLIGGFFISPVFPFYIGTQITIAVAAIFSFKFGGFNTPVRAIGTGFIIGVLSAVVSSPVTAIVFKGVAVPSITAINVLLLSSGKSLIESVITGALIVETIDKMIAGLLVHLVIRRLPQRFSAH